MTSTQQIQSLGGYAKVSTCSLGQQVWHNMLVDPDSDAEPFLTDRGAVAGLMYVTTKCCSMSLCAAVRHLWVLQYANTVICSMSQLTLVKLLVTNDVW